MAGSGALPTLMAVDADVFNTTLVGRTHSFNAEEARSHSFNTRGDHGAPSPRGDEASGVSTLEPRGSSVPRGGYMGYALEPGGGPKEPGGSGGGLAGGVGKMQHQEQAPRTRHSMDQLACPSPNAAAGAAAAAGGGGSYARLVLRHDLSSGRRTADMLVSPAGSTRGPRRGSLGESLSNLGNVGKKSGRRCSVGDQSAQLSPESPAGAARGRVSERLYRVVPGTPYSLSRGSRSPILTPHEAFRLHASMQLQACIEAVHSGGPRGGAGRASQPQLGLSASASPCTSLHERSSPANLSASSLGCCSSGLNPHLHPSPLRHPLPAVDDSLASALAVAVKATPTFLTRSHDPPGAAFKPRGARDTSQSQPLPGALHAQSGPLTSVAAAPAVPAASTYHQAKSGSLASGSAVGAASYHVHRHVPRMSPLRAASCSGASNAEAGAEPGAEEPGTAAEEQAVGDGQPGSPNAKHAAGWNGAHAGFKAIGSGRKCRGFRVGGSGLKGRGIRVGALGSGL